MAHKSNGATGRNRKKPRKGFTQIYNAFLDSDKLSQYDKIVFIAIKSFADIKTKKAFPSLATISRISGTSISQVRRSIAKMQELGIIKVESRNDLTNNGRISNLYTLYDSPDMWEDEFSTEEEDFKAVARELPDEILKAEFYRRMNIKKEPTSITDQSKDIDTFKNNEISPVNSSTKKNTSQDYSIDFIRDQVGYSVLKHDHPELINEIDYIIQIIYDTLNSSKDIIRVQQTDRPKEIVVSRLLKLSYEEILYVIRKYDEQTGKIEHPKAYMLTQLYEAAGQYRAEVRNQTNYDLDHERE